MPSIINSLFWKFLERIGYQSISFIVSIILARILMPSDYGYIAITMAFINLANIIIEGGLNSALIQKKNCDNEDYSTIFILTLILSIILYTILYLVAPLISSFYKNTQLTNILRILGLILFPSAINSVQNAILTRDLKFKRIFLSSFIGMVTSAVTGITFAKLNYGIWALVAQQVTLSFTTLLVMRHFVNWRPSFLFSFPRFKILYSYGWKIFLTNMIISLFLNIRSLIIGRAFSSASLAYFDRGKSLPSLIIDNINGSIQSVMFPVLSIKQDDKQSVKQLMMKSIQVSSFVIYPIIIGLFIIANPLVILLLTEKWLPVVPFIQIFCVAYLFMPIQNINMVAIKALGYSSTTLRLEIIKKLIEIIILIVSIRINVLAIAWGVVVYNVICIFINLYPTRKLLDYKYREQFMDVVPSFIISLTMGVIIYPFQIFIFNPIIVILVSVVTGFLSYILIAHYCGLSSYKYLIYTLRTRFFKY